MNLFMRPRTYITSVYQESICLSGLFNSFIVILNNTRIVEYSQYKYVCLRPCLGRTNFVLQRVWKVYGCSVSRILFSYFLYHEPQHFSFLFSLLSLPFLLIFNASPFQREFIFPGVEEREKEE